MMLLKICKVPVCCCLLFISLFAAAQTRDRIYIQSDRSGYVAGETIWLKAYLFSAFSPGSLGTNLLIDMVDESGKRILAGSLPVMGGTASGNIDLPLRIAQGIYFIRAYTKAQPSNTDYSFAVKPVYVFNPSIVKSTQILAPVSDYQCSFRPSSGNLVVGLVNLVYVSAYDLSGRPAVVEGTIVNTKNEESDVFKTDNNGKGKFAISPLPGEQYMARIRFADGTLKTYNLPKPDQNKVLIGISDLPKAKLFNVLIPEALRTGAMMHLRGFMDNNIVFEKNFSASVDHVSARIPVDELPSGLLQLVVTDSKKQKLGEANTFVLADSSIMSLQFHADTLNLSPGGKNVFSFVLPEDITGSFSVAITDYDKTLYTDENNIITGLLLNQDSHNNSFVSNSAIFNVAKKADLDMALGSTDWLDQSLYAGTNSVINDSDFIAIRGKIFNKGNRKPLTKGDITFMYTTRDSVTSMLTSPMAKDGSFSLRQLIFEGKQVFRYSVNGNKWDEIDMSLDTTKPEDVLRLPFNRSGMMVDRTVFADERKINRQLKLTQLTWQIQFHQQG